MSATRGLRPWKHWQADEAEYQHTLTALCESSLRRSFNPYTEIEWNAPEHSIRQDDPRWVLPPFDPLARHPWYQAQQLDKQIAIGLWRQANLAKSTLQLESLLVRGLLQHTFSLPNGSAEYRYCLHEAVEECYHGMMFQELVNRIGLDVPGLPRWLRWVSPLLPLLAAPLPTVFFFGVLAGEAPIDHLQRNALRGDGSLHPITARVMSIHVAEEARHIAFAHEYLRRRVPKLRSWQRFLVSVYVPIIMRVLGHAIAVPPRSFFRVFGIPRSVRRQLLNQPRSYATAEDASYSRLSTLP